MNETRGQESREKQFPLIELTRTFNAPIQRVWSAWSVGELMQQWWGPDDYTCPKAQIDFTEGGKYLMGMESPQGEIFWSTGQYKHIVMNKKIVFTDFFANKEGDVITPKKAGMKNWTQNYAGLITVTFEQEGDHQVRMTLQHQGIPAAMHDECVQGWNSCLEKMRNLVEGH